MLHALDGLSEDTSAHQPEECGQINFGRVVNSEVRVEVEAFRTRGSCSRA